MLRIVRVLAPNPSVYTLEGTNTWIVGEEPSIVIDPGPDDAVHLDEVARAAGRVAAVLVTHDHEDHAPGAPAFAERVGAPLHAFRLKGAEHLRDGQRFVVSGGMEVVAEYTPGHSSDHVAFFVPSEGALFTGDAVVGRGTSFIDPPDGDLAQYLRSLHRMQELNPRVIYPGHGPIVLDARAKLDEYVSHREDRERQVLELLGKGPRTTSDLVATIYAGYPAEVPARKRGGGGRGAVRPAGQGSRAALRLVQPGGAAGHRGRRRLEPYAAASGRVPRPRCASRWRWRTASGPSRPTVRAGAYRRVAPSVDLGRPEDGSRLRGSRRAVPRACARCGRRGSKTASPPGSAARGDAAWNTACSSWVSSAKNVLNGTIMVNAYRARSREVADRDGPSPPGFAAPHDRR